MWTVVFFLCCIILLGCTNGRETFVNKTKEEPYYVKGDNPPIPLTADEMNKYYFGYPKQIYDVPTKPVAHPLNYFYEPKHAPYTFGGYYQGLETPNFWPEDSKGGFTGVKPTDPKTH